MNNDILFIAPGIVIRSIVVHPRQAEESSPSSEESHEQPTAESDGE